jgi:hypothetical protein
METANEQYLFYQTIRDDVNDTLEFLGEKVVRSPFLCLCADTGSYRRLPSKTSSEASLMWRNATLTPLMLSC